MRATLKAHRWPVVVLAAVLMAVTGLVVGGALVPVPWTEAPVPAAFLLAPLAVVNATLPLAAVTPLAVTFAREPRQRVMRTVGALAVAIAAFVPALLVTIPEEMAMTGCVFLVLVAVGFAGVVVVGELAWLPVLGLGLALNIAEAMTRRLDEVLVPVAGVLVGGVVLAAALVAWCGPRSRAWT